MLIYINYQYPKLNNKEYRTRNKELESEEYVRLNSACV
jgi:hypothetical protein